MGVEPIAALAAESEIRRPDLSSKTYGLPVLPASFDLAANFGRIPKLEHLQGADCRRIQEWFQRGQIDMAFNTPIKILRAHVPGMIQSGLPFRTMNDQVWQLPDQIRQGEVRSGRVHGDVTKRAGPGFEPARQVHGG